MFFKITNQDTKSKWPLKLTAKINQYILYLDNGWNCFDNVYYKGYCIEQSLDTKIKSKDFTEQTGNYVIIDLSAQFPSIHYDNSRSFPMYYDSDSLTNLHSQELTAVWFDGAVKNVTGSWEFYHRPENSVQYEQKNTPGKDKIVDLLCTYLVSTVESFTTNMPIFAADSKGVDSTLIRSAFDYCNKSYTLVQNNNRDLADLGWGYRQLHVTDTPHVQLTGFCGDELLLRNPLYCQWLLDPYNIELIEEFDKVSHSYMKGFFDAKYKVKLQNRKEHFVNKEQAYNHAINVAINDFQMWHVDNTITFTPLRNRQIATECMYADIDAILDQVIHAGISKEIINRLNPKLLDTISKHKNDYE